MSVFKRIYVASYLPYKLSVLNCKTVGNANDSFFSWMLQITKVQVVHQETIQLDMTVTVVLGSLHHEEVQARMDLVGLTGMPWRSQGDMAILERIGTRIGRGTLIPVTGRVGRLLQIVTISSPLALADLKGIG
jgi:hypothetical protein